MTAEVKRDDYVRNNGPFYISHGFFDNRGPIVTKAFFRQTSSVFQHGDGSSKLSPASYPDAFYSNYLFKTYFVYFSVNMGQEAKTAMEAMKIEDTCCKENMFDCDEAQNKFWNKNNDAC